MNKEAETNNITPAESTPLTPEGRKVGTTPLFVEPEKMIDKFIGLMKETEQKAFEFFESRGGEFGKDMDDWFNAEAKLLRPIAIEVSETDEAINIKAALPGFKPEEIEMSVDGDQLTISGETSRSEEKDDGNVVYSDWQSDRFYRRVTLQNAVEADQVETQLKDGILTVSLKKSATGEPKTIAVTAG